MKKLFLGLMIAALFTSLLMPVFADSDKEDLSTLGERIRKKVNKEVEEELKKSLPPKNLGEKIREDVQKIIDKVLGDKKIIIGQGIVITNGKVTAVSGSTLTVVKDDKTYTVNTDANTQYRRHFWGKSSLAEIAVNNMVNVFGKFTDESKTTILARMIKNLSVQKRKGVFIGEVTTISGSNITLKTVNRGNQAVTVNSETEYVNRKEENINLADIKTGHRIRVKGVWDKANNTITEVTEVKDFSLP